MRYRFCGEFYVAGAGEPTTLHSVTRRYHMSHPALTQLSYQVPFETAYHSTSEFCGSSEGNWHLGQELVELRGSLDIMLMTNFCPGKKEASQGCDRSSHSLLYHNTLFFRTID